MSQAGIASITKAIPSIPTSFHGNTGIATPVGNVLNVVTANSTVQFVGSGNTLTEDFGISNLILGSSGSSISGALLNYGYGQSSLFSLTSGANNCGYGTNSLNALTSGHANCSYGNGSLENLTTGQTNCAFGNGCFAGIQSSSTGNTGIGYSVLFSVNGISSYNIAIGYQAGSAYRTTESSNILIGSAGVLGESNVMRLGTSGSGNVQVSSCYIAGITGVTVSNPELVTINSSTGQLGIQTLTQNNVLVGGASNSVSSVAPGSNGNVLTSNGTSWTSAAPAQPALVLLSTQTASSSASINFTSFLNAAYTSYKVKFTKVLPATNSQNFYMQVSTNNGSSYLSTAIYGGAYGYCTPSGSAWAINIVFNNADQFTVIDSIPNTAGSSFSGEMNIYNLNEGTEYMGYTNTMYFNSAGTSYTKIGVAGLNAQETVNALKFYFASGNIASGTIELYGVT
jgi:hypothetical protein|uniref:Uncharacterized protein n=1 Tax=uncultured Caudovirales phage TaxID=2100421 RepID=A0A6J5KV86_9CAUD|nr:hypothetical protein UFOVP88_5 [uncultured Caudovirales phage]